MEEMNDQQLRSCGSTDAESDACVRALDSSFLISSLLSSLVTSLSCLLRLVPFVIAYDPSARVCAVGDSLPILIATCCVCACLSSSGVSSLYLSYLHIHLVCDLSCEHRDFINKFRLFALQPQTYVSLLSPSTSHALDFLGVYLSLPTNISLPGNTPLPTNISLPGNPFPGSTLPRNISSQEHHTLREHSPTSLSLGTALSGQESLSPGTTLSRQTSLSLSPKLLSPEALPGSASISPSCPHGRTSLQPNASLPVPDSVSRDNISTSLNDQRYRKACRHVTSLPTTFLGSWLLVNSLSPLSQKHPAPWKNTLRQPTGQASSQFPSYSTSPRESHNIISKQDRCTTDQQTQSFNIWRGYLILILCRGACT